MKSRNVFIVRLKAGKYYEKLIYYLSSYIKILTLDSYILYIYFNQLI